MTDTTEREAFVAWLSGTYPTSHSVEDAEHYWKFEHVSALAWQAARASQAAPLPVAEGWRLVPVEPTPEIIAAAAIAAWPTASAADIAMARKAAPIVLMQSDLGPGFTVDSLAAALATMAPAYRAMIAAAPQSSHKEGDKP